ncbi:hypothetical protein ADL26_18965 [Thermoactinomyces vulgaris]|jgi:hypothetical protein|uniref:Uncharacterized protein n=1 Tax=Laceyella sediminis TaxID=573074 RepID=A0ABX5END7_9BACL|nr:hypothetical protein [Laceyella sediminis]KPC69374.1 hypothetical protein ADL26_18965 [Thermoactinomyces vulgaris]PRZ13963.1 hypothetical protein CLV36_107158 [Laceyella sediminis]
MSKAFAREELISANELKEISKDQLFEEKLHAFQKLGLVHNNELRAVILDIKAYEQLLDRLEELENMHEDLRLADEMAERLQIASTEWIEKSPNQTRLQFLSQLAETKRTP